MWWINDQLSPRWSNVSRPKLWLYGKWLLHFSSKCLCSSAGCRQLGGTTWRSVGSAHSFASASLGCGTPCGRTLWRCRGTWRLLVKKKKTQNVNDGKWFEWDLIRHGEEKERKKKKSDLVFLNSQNIFYMKPLSRGAVGKKKGRGERSGGTVKLRSFNSPDSEPLLFLWPW